MLWYYKNSSRRLADEVRTNTVEMFPRIAAKEPTKRSFSLVYKSLEDNVKQVVNRGTADCIYSSGFGRLSQSQ